MQTPQQTAAERHSAISAQLAAVDREIFDIQSAWEAGRKVAGHRAPASRRDQAARALLDGRPADPPPPDLAELRDRRSTLARAQQIANGEAARAEADDLRSKVGDYHSLAAAFTVRAAKALRPTVALLEPGREILTLAAALRAEREWLSERCRQAGDLRSLNVNLDPRIEGNVELLFDALERVDAVLRHVDAQG